MPTQFKTILLEKGLIAAEDLDAAMADMKNSGETLKTILVREGLIAEDTYLRTIAEHAGIPFMELSSIQIEKPVIDMVPAKYPWHYKIMPIRLENNVLTIATHDPDNSWPIDDLETNLG